MRKPFSFLLASVCGWSVQSQPFQNLDFEQVKTDNLVQVGGPGSFYGPAEDLIPGWQLFSDGILEQGIGLNIAPPGIGFHALMTRRNLNDLPYFGRYSLAMQPGWDPQTGRFSTSWLVQTGEVSPDANSIQFINYGDRLELRVNNQPVPLFYENISSSFNPAVALAIASGDISRFAGQTVEMKFVAAPVSGIPLYGLDNIEFSSQIIPEPSTWMLLCLGGAALLVGHRKMRRR